MKDFDLTCLPWWEGRGFPSNDQESCTSHQGCDRIHTAAGWPGGGRAQEVDVRSRTAAIGAGLLATAVALAVAVTAPAAVSAAPSGGHVTGTLPDGASWVADVPAQWNGTVLLYS